MILHFFLSNIRSKLTLKPASITKYNIMMIIFINLSFPNYDIISKSAKALKFFFFFSITFFFPFQYIILILLIFILYAFCNHNLFAREILQ